MQNQYKKNQVQRINISLKQMLYTTEPQQSTHKQIAIVFSAFIKVSPTIIINLKVVLDFLVPRNLNISLHYIVEFIDTSSMFWNQNHTQDNSQPQQLNDFDADDTPPVLSESDFVKMIDLEEKYNYYKSVIKIETYNHFDQAKSQNSMMKVMLELIEYYAQCISEAQANIENIVKYFQHKMKEVNGQYKKIMDKGKQKQKQKEITSNIANELGTVKQIKQLKIPICDIDQSETTKQTGNRFKDLKASINNTLMLALQNQDIQAHIAQTDKKAERIEKKIASTIQNQEEDLDRRRNEARIKREESQKKNKSFSMTEASSNPASSCRNGKGKNNRNLLSSFGSNCQFDEMQFIEVKPFVLSKLEEANLQVKLSQRKYK